MLSRENRLKVGDYFGAGAPKPARIIKKSLILIKIYSSHLDCIRCGVVIGKALDKRASARNRVKRAIFDACGELIPKLSPADYLFFPAVGLAKLTRREIIENIDQNLNIKNKNDK